MFKLWLKKIVLFPLFLILGVEDGSAAGGDPGQAAAGDTLLGGGQGEPGAGDAGAGGTTETADGLFTPEEIAAKKESVATAKAEETRRAALTQEQRDAEDTAAAAQKAEEEKGKAGAPDQYEEFKRPEGMENVELNQEAVDALKPIAKDLGLSQDKAQALFGRLLTDVYPKIEAQRVEAWNGIVKGWADASKADKEIGGEKFTQNAEIAQRALNTFGTPELKAALNQFGMGNHPELVRLMYRIGNAMREDTIVMPGSKAAGSNDETILANMYPSMQPKTE